MVTGQSATRVHPAVESLATQQWAVEVEDDACLVVLPGPTIPFRGCRYYQRGRVELAAAARLIWGDIWLPGRYERGELSERFQFERIVQDFEVRRAGRLVYRDRFRWDGPWTPEEADWYFGGSPGLRQPVRGRADCRSILPEATAGVRSGRLPARFRATLHAMVRAARPTVTADLVRCRDASGRSNLDRGLRAPRPGFWNRPSLAPNHWFSTLRSRGAGRRAPRTLRT